MARQQFVKKAAPYAILCGKLELAHPRQIIRDKRLVSLGVAFAAFAHFAREFAYRTDLPPKIRCSAATLAIEVDI